MDTAPFAEASHELRGRFFSLIDSLSTLRGLTGLELQHRDERELLREALDVLLRHQDLERCSIYVVEDGRLVNAAGRTWRELIASGPRAAAAGAPAAEPAEVGEAIMRRVVETGEPMVCDDWAREAAAAGAAGGSLPPRGAFVCTPIVVRGDVTGVVNVYHPRPGALQPWHRQTLDLFCAVLAHMIENNRLLRSLEHAVDERTRQLEAALREAQQLKRRYEDLSHVDELTGLHNRRFFFPEAEAALARSVRYEQPFSLMLVDIDRFKRVNDALGHEVGDRVLRRVADAIRTRIREGDIIARFGGEEFVVALPSTPIGGAVQLAERIRESLAGLDWVGIDAELAVTASFGVAELGAANGTGETKPLLEALLRDADRAMYRAKAEGRDRVIVHDPHA